MSQHSDLTCIRAVGRSTPNSSHEKRQKNAGLGLGHDDYDFDNYDYK